MALPSKFSCQLNLVRTFLNARVKWVRDPYLDSVVEKEKNLRQAIFLMNHIVSSPSQSLPLSAISLLKSPLDLPTTTAKFVEKYHSIFMRFQPGPGLPPHVKLTRPALALHKDELAIRSSMTICHDIVKRLSRLLMLAGISRLPIYIVDQFKWDLGLPHDYITVLLADYPDYFDVSEVEDPLTGKGVLALEIVSWRKELAVSELEKREMHSDYSGGKRRHDIAFPMGLPKGFDLEKRVKTWVEEWQSLPYISPYENAFHLEPNSDQAEKWVVAILHELLWLLVSKKTDREYLLALGGCLGLEKRFRKALINHPGIFYISNKIRTQTVVLREAYRKDFLMEKHPLMSTRYWYIHLMTKAENHLKPAKMKDSQEVKA